jgi:hypothetical protein
VLVLRERACSSRAAKVATCAAGSGMGSACMSGERAICCSSCAVLAAVCCCRAAVSVCALPLLVQNFQLYHTQTAVSLQHCCFWDSTGFGGAGLLFLVGSSAGAICEYCAGYVPAMAGPLPTRSPPMVVALLCRCSGLNSSTA